MSFSKLVDELTSYITPKDMGPGDIINITTTGNTWAGEAITISPGMIWGGITTRDATPEQKEYAVSEMQRLKHSAAVAEVNEKAEPHSHVATLKDLGFDSLAQRVKQAADRSFKENMAAISGFKKITEEQFGAAGKRIRENSNYALELALTPVKEYLGQDADRGSTDTAVSLPPAEVLKTMASAKETGIFDSFAVIHVRKAPDPIIVGQIRGSNDMWFVAEWGDDIRLSDIV